MPVEAHSIDPLAIRRYAQLDRVADDWRPAVVGRHAPAAMTPAQLNCDVAELLYHSTASAQSEMGAV